MDYYYYSHPAIQHCYMKLTLPCSRPKSKSKQSSEFAGACPSLPKLAKASRTSGQGTRFYVRAQCAQLSAPLCALNQAMACRTWGINGGHRLLQSEATEKETLADIWQREGDEHGQSITEQDTHPTYRACTDRVGKVRQRHEAVSRAGPRMTRSGGDGEIEYPQGVDKIIIGPIIVSSTSQGGFFHLTMQLHFCAFNIPCAVPYCLVALATRPVSFLCPSPSHHGQVQPIPLCAHDDRIGMDQHREEWRSG